jgi:hypothetical protein
MGHSVWDDIDNPKLDEGLNGPKLPYLYPGRFLMRVRKVSQYASAKPHQKDTQWFRVDLDILEGARDGKDAVAWVVNLTRGGDMAKRDIRSFVHALLGKDAPINKELMDQLCGAEQPGIGLTLRCEAITKPTLAGGDFTQVYWTADDAAEG